jgi:hypothetical protein
MAVCALSPPTGVLVDPEQPASAAASSASSMMTASTLAGESPVLIFVIR